MANELQIGGKTPSDIYADIRKTGVSELDASLIVSGWIYQNFGRVQRTFTYHQAFLETETDCAPKYNQSFHHQDWVDGEDVVQATQSPGEDGFNLRFHRIESDLAALGTDTSRLFACMADMRKELFALLEEIRTEINRINADNYNSSWRDPGFQTAPPPFGGVVKNPLYKGTSKFDNKEVNIWETEQGTMILPAVKTAGMDITDNPRMDRMSGLMKFVEDNKDVRPFGAQPFTTKDFVAKFGNNTASNGMLVKDLVQILPDNLQFKSVDEMVSAVTERETAALKTSGDLSAVLTSSLGIEITKPAGTADVNRLGNISDSAKAALAKAGIDTVEKLAGADPKTISNILAGANISGFTAGDMAAWVNTAKVIRVLR